MVCLYGNKFQEISENKIGTLVSQVEDEILAGNHKKFKSIINELDPTLLPDFAAALLHMLYRQQLGYDYKRDEIQEITNSKKQWQRNEDGYVRIFITAGSMDRIKASNIINFFVSKAGIRKDDIGDIDIKRKFTFVDINEQVISKVLKKCNRQKINNRRIEIEIANQK